MPWWNLESKPRKAGGERAPGCGDHAWVGGPGLPQGPHGWPCRAVGAWGAPEQALYLQPLLVEQAEIHTEERGQQKCQHEDPGQASRAPPSSLHGIVCVWGGGGAPRFFSLGVAELSLVKRRCGGLYNQLHCFCLGFLQCVFPQTGSRPSGVRP